MTQVYLDANIVVYLVERAPRAMLVRQQLLQLPYPQIYTSDLVLCECLVVPLRNNDHALVRTRMEVSLSVFLSGEPVKANKFAPTQLQNPPSRVFLTPRRRGFSIAWARIYSLGD